MTLLPSRLSWAATGPTLSLPWWEMSTPQATYYFIQFSAFANATTRKSLQFDSSLEVGHRRRFMGIATNRTTDRFGQSVLASFVIARCFSSLSFLTKT